MVLSDPPDEESSNTTDWLPTSAASLLRARLFRKFLRAEQPMIDVDLPSFATERLIPFTASGADSLASRMACMAVCSSVVKLRLAEVEGRNRNADKISKDDRVRYSTMSIHCVKVKSAERPRLNRQDQDDFGELKYPYILYQVSCFYSRRQVHGHPAACRLSIRSDRVENFVDRRRGSEDSIAFVREC